MCGAFATGVGEFGRWHGFVVLPTYLLLQVGLRARAVYDIPSLMSFWSENEGSIGSSGGLGRGDLVALAFGGAPRGHGVLVPFIALSSS